MVNPTSNRAIEQKANKHAEVFVDAYYLTYDSPSRSKKLLDLYRADARIVWNGNAIAGPSQLSTVLLAQLPFSKHEVQSFDAHVIPGTPDRLPTLSINITGQVIFSAQPFRPSFKMPDSKLYTANQNPTDAEIALNGLPRVFSQSLILVPKPDAAEAASSYVIVADCFRFVG
ncbi:hypothetical protein CROQUDRAFT_653716 [Cronartium quercuum f. sp. fusiforme G11]|uniref:NTF2 domain-containing protein n=1 Tax=Cronartium quercuum f. sp. fusiforme G11 TaxID=708437 RepID=A0A9P6TF61_9BASI|nr:hypothetical protein CROQUDRAFT_653716 [Cronartium quercuum f. sp. fusiforme G11]